MRSNYKPLGNYIREIDERDTGRSIDLLLGVSIQKKFIPSIANTIGTDMSTYKIVKRNQFAYGPVTSRNGDKISIALLEEYDQAIISQAYTSFEVTDTNQLLPEYLMMWFRRPEFDRYARYMSHGSAREIFGWGELCDTKLPVPSIAQQKEIVAEYNVIQDRIKLNQELIQNLNETAQATYKLWFVDFEFPISAEQATAMGTPELEGKPYKSGGGEMVESELGEIPKGWKVSMLSTIVDQKHPITYGVVKPGEEVPNGVKFIRSGDIESGRIIFSQLRTISTEISNQFKRTKLIGGELLISIVGNPGQVAIVPYFLRQANIARQVAMLRITAKDLALYVKNVLSSNTGQESLRNIILGSVQDVINLEDLRKLKVVLPCDNITKKYNRISEPLEMSQQRKFFMNEQLVALRNLILSKLSTIEDPLHGRNQTTTHDHEKAKGKIYSRQQTI